MATTPLSQAVMQGMDPNIYRPLSDISQGNALLEQGIDASPTSKWGAIARLANAGVGSWLSNSATSELAKTIAGGKKKSMDDIMAAIGGGRSSAIPTAPPAMVPRAVAAPAATPAAAAPAIEPGSPNVQVASRFPADMSPGTAASPLPADAAIASPLDTAQWPAGPNGAPSQMANAPRGIRNNNPLNIEAGDFTKGQPGFAGSDGRFAKFETPEHGVAAASKLLDIYDQKHGLNTVAGIVNRWAPKADGNDTMAYAADVAGRLGIDPNAPVPKEMRPQLIAAMAQHENGQAAPGTDQTPYQVAGPAVAAPKTATAADDEEIPANAASTQGQQPQAAAAKGIDVHRLMAVLQNPYADDTTKQLAQKLLLEHLTPKEEEFASGPQGIYNKRTGVLQQPKAPEDDFASSPQGICNKRTGELKKDVAGGANDFGGLQGKDLLTAVQKANPAVASQVTAIIEGRVPYPTGSRLNPVQQQVKELVTQVDPTFEQGNSGARIKVRNEFEAGGANSPAGAITAGNTAIQHLGHLSDEAEKLGNFDSGLPLNNFVNGLKNDMARGRGQGIAAANFDSIRNKYIEEATKFYRGTGGTEADLERDIASLNSAQSPSQLRDVIKTQAGLMQSKINALQERWKRGMGPMVQEFPIIHPESQSAVDRINLRQAGKAVPADGAKPAANAAGDGQPAGAPKTIASKAEYDALPAGSPYVAPDGSVRTKK